MTATRRPLSPRIQASLRDGRSLGQCEFLTKDDWAQIFDAYCAFLYQSRLIVYRREAILGWPDRKEPTP